MNCLKMPGFFLGGGVIECPCLVSCIGMHKEALKQQRSVWSVRRGEKIATAHM